MLKRERSERAGERGVREGERGVGEEEKGGMGFGSTQFQVNDNRSRPEHRHDKTKQLSIPIFETKETKRGDQHNNENCV